LAGARILTGRQLDGNPPPYPFEAPHTSINRAISAHRRIAFAELQLSEIQRIRQVLGGTTNDVVLAIVAGAMHTFFDKREEDLDKPLVAMVPVSVRTESEQGVLGNRLSAMMVPLADGVAEPAERLRLISEKTRTAKERRSGPGSDVFAGWAQALSPAIATRLTRLVSNVRLFDHLSPIFNLIVSNVPGPDFPLYFAGARMVAMYPVGPIIEGVGINVTVFSYQDTMYVGIQGCWELVPDIDTIVHGMHGAMEELIRDVNRKVRPVPWWHGELPA
jgi:WS/DGAT/MGAT family acyltransferase